MLREGLSAPVRARDSVGTLVIGGVLTLLSIVFLPAWVLFAVLEPTIALVSTPIVVFPTLLLRGYALRVIDAAIRSKSTTPSFVRWGSLARDGLKSIVLSGVYLVPAGCFALLSGGAMLLLSADLTGMNAIGQLGTAMSGGIAALVALSYLLVYLYIRPAAEAVLSTTGRFKDALSPRIVLGTAAKGDFATGWVLSVFVILVGGVIGLSTIVVLVGGVLLFGIRVVAANLLGQGASSTLAPPTHSGVGPTAGTSQQPRSSTHAPTETVRSKAKAPVPPVSDADEWKSEPDADVQVGRPLMTDDGFGSFQRATLEEEPHPESGTDDRTGSTDPVDVERKSDTHAERAVDPSNPAGDDTPECTDDDLERADDDASEQPSPDRATGFTWEPPLDDRSEWGVDDQTVVDPEDRSVEDPKR